MKRFAIGTFYADHYRRREKPRQPKTIRTAQSRVNPCFENPCHRAVSSDHDAPQLVPSAILPCADRDAVAECGREDGGVAALEKGRVLLLDDDLALREIITEFLAESGYKVVAVQNGGEGVREVLANDFALVVCDFHMPSLAGDLFYRAVERIRPELCQRFVFMTGHRDDAKTNDFIRKVNGLVLWKPFRMDALLEAITIQEVRRDFHGVFDGTATEQVSPRDRRVGADFLGGGSPIPQEPDIEQKVAAILARGPRTPTPPSEVTADAAEPDESESPAGRPARSLAVVGLVFLLLIAGGIWMRYFNARGRVEAAAAQRVVLEAEWSAVLQQLDAALSVRSEMESHEVTAARLSADRAARRWTPVLRSLVPAMGAGIEVLEIDAHSDAHFSGNCEVRVRGVAAGALPRQVADRFRQAMEASLRENFIGQPASTHFEQLDDLPGSDPESMRAAFVLVAASGSMVPPVTTRKGAR